MIKLDQIGFPHQFINFPMKICHIYRKDKNDWFIFDVFGSNHFLDHIGLNLSKMDQSMYTKCVSVVCYLICKGMRIVKTF